jgi:hypothetical protein
VNLRGRELECEYMRTKTGARNLCDMQNKCVLGSDRSTIQEKCDEEKMSTFVLWRNDEAGDDGKIKISCECMRLTENL